MAGRAIIAALVASLSVSACVATAGVTCDINYVGPPPQHYLNAGRALNPLIVEADYINVEDHCPGTPVGCAVSNTFGMNVIVITTIPERWGLTRQQVVDHEVAHIGGWPACHPT